MATRSKPTDISLMLILSGAMFILSIGMLILSVAGCGPLDGESPDLELEEMIGSTQMAYTHGTPPGPAPWPYYLTTFGAGSDAQQVACGGPWADGTWYYSTGVYTFGCNSKLKLEANGKCVVVEVVDNGPAAWVESNAAQKCGGLGYIIDASPLASQELFGTSSAGWSDCYAIQVSEVADSTPSGPCQGSSGPSCGNNIVEQGETCDPPSSCPQSCNDGNPCTEDLMQGSAATCNATCQHPPLTACIHGDGCCPGGCNSGSDSDCSPACGNGIIDPGETCDPPSSCPQSCNDGNPCTADLPQGNPATCNATCQHPPVTACVPGDGCCPGGCNSGSDSDCSPACGNGSIDPGETCDPPSSCPQSCNDNNPCTADMMQGSASTCSATCQHTPIDPCGDDGDPGGGDPVGGDPGSLPGGGDTESLPATSSNNGSPYEGVSLHGGCIVATDIPRGMPTPHLVVLMALLVVCLGRRRI